MPIEKVNSGTGTTLGWTPAVGNLLVVSVTSFQDTSSMSLSDSYGNTWVSSVDKEDPSGYSFSQIFYCYVTASGPSMTISSKNLLHYVNLSEYAGVPKGIISVRCSSSNSGTGTALSISPVSLNANDLLYCGYEVYSPGTWSGLSSGWTPLTSSSYSYSDYQIAATATTYNCSITLSASTTWVALCVVFCGQPTPPTITPLGGAYTQAQTVTISGPANDVVYTTDGTTPSMGNGLTYCSPVVISVSCTLKAVVSDSYSEVCSDVTSATYAIGASLNSHLLACCGAGT